MSIAHITIVFIVIVNFVNGCDKNLCFKGDDEESVQLPIRKHEGKSSKIKDSAKAQKNEKQDKLDADKKVLKNSQNSKDEAIGNKAQLINGEKPTSNKDSSVKQKTNAPVDPQIKIPERNATEIKAYRDSELAKLKKEQKDDNILELTGESCAQRRGDIYEV